MYVQPYVMQGRGVSCCRAEHKHSTQQFRQVDDGYAETEVEEVDVLDDATGRETDEDETSTVQAHIDKIQDQKDNVEGSCKRHNFYMS